MKARQAIDALVAGYDFFHHEASIFSEALMVGAIGAVLFFGGCTTGKRELTESPGSFPEPVAAEQHSSQQGQIRDGMSRDAVCLAWGAPDQKVRGEAAETMSKRGSISIRPLRSYYPRPVYVMGPYGGSATGIGCGGGVGYRHPYRRAFDGFYYDPSTIRSSTAHANIVRYPDRTVSFEGGRVIAFQFLPAPVFYYSERGGSQ